MKKLFLPLLVVANFAFAQNCDEVIKENNYLKTSLNMVSGKSIIVDNLKFTPVSIISSSKNNSSRVEILIPNVGKDVRDVVFNFNNNDILDMQGNSYKILNAKVGQIEQERVDQYSVLGYKLNVDIPTKIIYTVEKIPENVQFIKAVQIGFLGGPQKYEHLVATLKDIKVSTE